MILYIKPTLVITNVGLVFDFLLSLILVFLIFNHRMISCEFFSRKTIRIRYLYFWLFKEQLKALLDSMEEWQKPAIFWAVI
jgi:hypothetical protein